MSEDFGPTFLTVTDEEGKELVLEFMTKEFLSKNRASLAVAGSR